MSWALAWVTLAASHHGGHLSPCVCVVSLTPYKAAVSNLPPSDHFSKALPLDPVIELVSLSLRILYMTLETKFLQWVWGTNIPTPAPVEFPAEAALVVRSGNVIAYSAIFLNMYFYPSKDCNLSNWPHVVNHCPPKCLPVTGTGGKIRKQMN